MKAILMMLIIGCLSVGVFVTYRPAEKNDDVSSLDATTHELENFASRVKGNLVFVEGGEFSGGIIIFFPIPRHTSTGMRRNNIVLGLPKLLNFRIPCQQRRSGSMRPEVVGNS